MSLFTDITEFFFKMLILTSILNLFNRIKSYKKFLINKIKSRLTIKLAYRIIDYTLRTRFVKFFIILSGFLFILLEAIVSQILKLTNSILKYFTLIRPLTKKEICLAISFILIIYYFEEPILMLIDSLISAVFINHNRDMNIIPIYFFILFLISTLASFLFISYLGYIGVFYINLFSILLFWFSLTTIYFYLGYENIYFYINLGTWFKINNSSSVSLEFFIDYLSLSYTLLTTSIALSVIIYTFSYFRYEPLVDRLIILISFFVASMIVLVNAGNFFVLFLGWELIGLSSFLLINFWNTRVSTLKAAFKAFTFNKLSDLTLLTAIILIYSEFYTININIFRIQLTNFIITYYSLWNFKLSTLEIISFLIIVSAFIKSAQFGFHLWLPDSMEAPVPASALIHSATLVSAGVFLILRLNQLFELSLFSYTLIQLFGSITAFYGGFCAVFQSDIKKLLAYSTISHCGFLMVCASTELVETTVLYLYIHGFFKAASFLCVGNIIRVSLNYQDFRRMGGYFKYLPFEFYTLSVCLFNLGGFPFSFGYYSKHFLFLSLNNNSTFYWFTFLSCFCGALCGFIYCFRLIYNVFFDFKKAPKNVYTHMNNKNYKSIYYSNSSLLSTTAIILLLINCYCFCGYLIFAKYSLTNLLKSSSEFLFSNTNYYLNNNKNYIALKNFKLFNSISLILVIFLSTVKYKYNFFFFKSINNFIFFLFFFLFFFALI